MPEVNTDKIFAAFLLRLEEVAQIEDFDDIEKDHMVQGCFFQIQQGVECIITKFFKLGDK